MIEHSMAEKIENYRKIEKLVNLLRESSFFEEDGIVPALLMEDEFEFRFVKAALITMKAFIDAEKEIGPFICGEAGEKDYMNLPDKLFVCPHFGLDGFAVYQKVKDYDAPGY